MKRASMSLIAVLASVLVLAACSGAPPSTPSAESTVNVVQSQEPQSEPVAVDGPTEEDIVSYFEAIATGDPKAASEAADMAAADSNAFAYATYIASTYQASRDAGISSEKQVLEEIEGGYALCPEVVTDDYPCAEFTNIAHVGDQIADFDTGGEPLAGRISLGSGETLPLGEIGEAKLVASYKSIAGHVVVTFDVTSKSNGLFVWATYIAPDGRQSQSTAQYGPSELASGAFGTYTFMFEGADYGGSVLLQPHSADSYETEATTFATQ